MTIDSDGNVGIGTTSPDNTLHVKSSTEARIKLENTNTTDNAVLNIKSGTKDMYLFNDNSSGMIYLRNHDDKDLVMDSDGNVGIGTTSPEETLHIKSNRDYGSNFKQTQYAYHADTRNVYNYCQFIANGIMSATMGIEYDYYAAWTGSSYIPTTNNHTRMNIISNNGGDPTEIYDSTNQKTCIMTIQSDGKVGIANNSPSYTLHVGETIYTTTLYVNGQGVTSDKRIKTDISLVDDDKALQQVNALESKEYHYIDPDRRRETKTIGFIAQEVKEVIPNAISLINDYVPDELRVILEPQWETDGSNNYLIVDDLDFSGNNTGKCRFYISNDISGNNETKEEVACEKDESGNYLNKFKFKESAKYVFLHGKEVTDFHSIDKNQIFALHHSAIQELDRKHIRDVNALQVETTALQAETAALQVENTALKNDIEVLKTQMQQILTKIA